MSISYLMQSFKILCCWIKLRNSLFSIAKKLSILWHTLLRFIQKILKFWFSWSQPVLIKVSFIFKNKNYVSTLETVAKSEIFQGGGTDFFLIHFGFFGRGPNFFATKISSPSQATPLDKKINLNWYQIWINCGKMAKIL